MNKKDLTSRCTGIYFGEGPRWKENKLWFSDMQGDKVYTLDEDNNLETICDVKNQPSGLGWLPNGDLLIEKNYILNIFHFLCLLNQTN